MWNSGYFISADIANSQSTTFGAASEQWNSPHWGFNNDENDSDQCHRFRIAMDKQIYEGHTGCGGIIGTSCNAENSPSSVYNLVKEMWADHMTYRCVASGSEPRDQPIAADTSYAIFVRSSA